MGRRRGTSAFPVARIKKMMQSDDDVGKIATVTPVLVAKALELMMEYVLKEAALVARERHTKTVTPHHLKTCVMSNDSFDFLRDVLRDVQIVEDDKPGRRGKRCRSPANEGRRVRRGREDVKDSRALDKEQVIEESVVAEDRVDVVVEKGKEDEEDDYDEDDDNAGDTAKDTNDDSATIPVESQSAAGRMSVSALLS